MRGRPPGFKHTEETRRKISEIRRSQHLRPLGMLGKKHTPEAIEKIRLASTGRVKSAETRRKMSIRAAARIYSPELKEHNRQALLRPEVRLKKSLSRKGEKSHFWRGGLSRANKLIRESYRYKVWRASVFKRDGYRCVNGCNGKYLNADHIKPFALYPELRFELSNGRTLCVECHRKTDTFGRKTIKSN